MRPGGQSLVLGHGQGLDHLAEEGAYTMLSRQVDKEQARGELRSTRRALGLSMS